MGISARLRACRAAMGDWQEYAIDVATAGTTFISANQYNDTITLDQCHQQICCNHKEYAMQLVQTNRRCEGEQRIYRFDSKVLKPSTNFGIYLPPHALEGHSCRALFYLAGLPCTEQTVAIKAHAQRLEAHLGLILSKADT